MKKILVLSILFVVVITGTQCQNTKWEHAVLLRKNVMERKFGIPFSNEWSPKVAFKNSDTIDGEIISYNGMYVSEDSSFRFNGRFKTATIPSIGDTVTPLADSIRLLIDHELGHALVDQLSRRLYNKTWPVKTSFYSYWQAIEVRILSEGMADYFRNMLSYDTSSHIESLPDGPYGDIWKTSNWIYDGGYWTVKPIIETYGQKGLEYIMTNPLSVMSYDVRSACAEYQKIALEELALLR